VARHATVGGWTRDGDVVVGSVYMVWEYAQQSSSVICSIASHFQMFARQNADYASADAIKNLSPADAAATIYHPANWHHLAIRDLTFTHTGFIAGSTPRSRKWPCRFSAANAMR